MSANQTFDDEFNSQDVGNGGQWQAGWAWDPNGYEPPGTTSWEVNPNYGPTSGVNAYTDDNGVLSLNFMPTPGSMSSAVGGAPFLTGAITTAQSFSQTYGYFEMNAELPAGAGLNAAFLLLPTSGAWPPELDVEEVLGSDPTTLVNTAHWDSGNSANPMWSNIPDASQGFHTYAVDWEPDTITWYFDGKQVAQQATPSDMHQPMYMAIDDLSGTPGSWAGAPDSGETASMKINWVHAYSSNPYANGATPAPASSDTASTPSTDTTSTASTGSNSTQSNSTPAASNPSAPASPDNTVVTAAGGGSITDASGNTWSITNGQVAVNGTPDGTTANVTELAYENGLVWQENSSNLWWSKSSPSDTWSPGSGTATSLVPASSTSTPASTVSPDTLALVLSEDAYAGDAQFIVKVDGTQLGAPQSVTASNSAGQTQTFDYSGNWGPGAHNVEVDFLNDAYAGPGQDRNLYVDQVSYNGQAAMSQPSPLYGNGGVTIPVGHA